VSIAQLGHKRHLGELREGSLLWKEGMDGWVALAALPADVMARVDEAAEIAQIEEEMAAIEAEEQQQG